MKTTNKLMRFEYTNWRGEDHEYVVRPESLDCVNYMHGKDKELMVWVMHAWVITRDKESRPGRRTFILNGLRNVEYHGVEDRMPCEEDEEEE